MHFSIPALFSTAAVVCMTLGFITLLCMVIVAVYKSNQPKELGKGSKGIGQGMYYVCQYTCERVHFMFFFILTLDPEERFFSFQVLLQL